MSRDARPIRPALLTVVTFAVLLAAVAVFVTQALPSQQRVALIVRGGTVVTMDAGRRVLAPGAVAIDGQNIVNVGTPAQIAEHYVADDTIDATGSVVMPGLINTHGHAAMVLLRGLADDLALMDWLNHYIFPAEGKLVSPHFVRIGSELAILEMIQSGTTLFTDMYYFEEEVAKAAKAAGIRGVLGQTIIGFPVADARTPAEGLQRASALIDAYLDDPLVVPAVGTHSMYTLDAESLKAARNLAFARQVPLLVHLSETRDEAAISQERHQLSPTAYLDSLGFWSPNTLAAHGVWLSDDDIAVLAKRRAGLSHNPESNMKLASGTAAVGKWLAAGIASGLGTDGAASNNDLDMFDTMRTTALLHKLVDNDPTSMPAMRVLEMATIGGAMSLNMAGRIGSLEYGKRADLIVVNMRTARQTPLYNPISHLVYVTRGDDVTTSIIDGRIVMRDRKVLTMDAPRVLAAADAMAVKVREAVAEAAAKAGQASPSATK